MFFIHISILKIGLYEIRKDDTFAKANCQDIDDTEQDLERRLRMHFCVNMGTVSEKLRVSRYFCYKMTTVLASLEALRN